MDDENSHKVSDQQETEPETLCTRTQGHDPTSTPETYVFIDIFRLASRQSVSTKICNML